MILKIVEPVIARPLSADWDAAHSEIRAFSEAMKRADADRQGSPRSGVRCHGRPTPRRGQGR